MKIEFKRFSYNERMSQGTCCYSADLWVDGKKLGEVSNEGRGGCTNLEIPWDDQKKIEAYCETLPPLYSDGMKLSMNWDFYMEQLAWKYVNLSKARKVQNAGKTTFRTSTEPDVWQTVKFPFSPENKLKMLAKWPDIVEFLNELVDNPKALDIYAGQEAVAEH